MPSKGYDSSYRGSNNPGAFYHITGTDFGVTAGGTAPALTASASGGSLATSTARVAVAWITAEGLSQVSLEATAAVTGPTGSVSVVKPTTPTTTGQPILGWAILSSAGAAGSALLNASGTNPASVAFVTTRGTIQGFLLSTTPVVIQVYGAGQAEPAVDGSGIQPALPAVAPNSTAIADFIVPNSGSQWKVQKSVDFSRPDGTQETAGIAINHLDCISPLYPGVATVVTAGTYFVMNGYLFVATTGGTTASTFIGFKNFNLAKNATTTDNTVVWTSYAKAVLVRAVFSNSSGTAATPVAQTYDIFML